MLTIDFSFFTVASPVSYSIMDGNKYDAFTIDEKTGEIRVNRKLDYENITEVIWYSSPFFIYVFI